MISESLIEWADTIFAMEDSHKDVILSIDPGVENKVVVLDIRDRYRRGDPNLTRLLKEKLGQHLGQIWK